MVCGHPPAGLAGSTTNSPASSGRLGAVSRQVGEYRARSRARLLEQLAVLISITARRSTRRGKFEPQHALGLAVRDEPVRGSRHRDHEVIAGAIGNRPKDGLQRPAALVDEEHLVRLAVPIEARHRLSRPHHAKGDVAVGEERRPGRSRHRPRALRPWCSPGGGGGARSVLVREHRADTSRTFSTLCVWVGGVLW